jgi:hypothetical protein
MLDKQIIRLKNLIFLKLTCFSIICLGVAYLLPEMAHERSVTEESLSKSYNQLNNLKVKVNYLKQNPETVTSAEKYYISLLHEPSNIDCLERLKLISSIKELAEDLKVDKNFDLRVSNPAPDVKFAKFTQWIKTNTMQVEIDYGTNELLRFIQIAERIYDSLPENSYIESINISKNNIINSENLIEQENDDSIPKLINGQVVYKVNKLVTHNNITKNHTIKD